MKVLLGSLLLASSVVSAKLPPFDFTGSWSGTQTYKGQSTPISADFTQTSPKHFSGNASFGVLGNCQINGRYGRPILIHGKCGVGSGTAHAHLDIPTATMRISFSYRHGNRLTMILTKNPS
jgi:hypothetical protein